MTTHRYHLCRSILLTLLVALSVHLAHAATDVGVSTVPPGNTEPPAGTEPPSNTEPPATTDDPTNDPFSPTTSAPADVASTNAFDDDPTGSAVTQETNVTATATMNPDTEPPSPSPTTTEPIVIPEACLCDLTSGFCDIGCCCDIVDCRIPDLSTVFNGCTDKLISGDCIEKWLMFRANVDPSFITVTDTLFCVQLEGDNNNNSTAPQSLPGISQRASVLDSYHFAWQGSGNTPFHTRPFYRIDDVILSQYSSSSARSLLRQPGPGAGTSSCTNQNPAKFLRSESLSCTRTLTPQSCSSDTSLNAKSYFTELSLIKVPVADTVDVSALLIPVTPQADWPEPREQNGSCLNVVSKVEYVIGITGAGELMVATVNVILVNTSLDTTLRQSHSVRFQVDTPPTTAQPLRPVGLPVGTHIIGRFGEEEQTLTVMGMSQGGECSSDPNLRTLISFTHNTITGCTFSSPSTDCSLLSAQLYEILQGKATPHMMAMNFGPTPDWARVITQNCSILPQEARCESGCLLPLSLSVQVLWARLGDPALPQSFILGAKYTFSCHTVQCPINSPLAVTTEVTFADLTVYPEPPRGSPQPWWKFPFGFFTRGMDELDGQTVNSGAGKVTWNTVWLMLILSTVREMLTR